MSLAYCMTFLRLLNPCRMPKQNKHSARNMPLGASGNTSVNKQLHGAMDPFANRYKALNRPLEAPATVYNDCHAALTHHVNRCKALNSSIGIPVTIHKAYHIAGAGSSRLTRPFRSAGRQLQQATTPSLQPGSTLHAAQHTPRSHLPCCNGLQAAQ